MGLVQKGQGGNWTKLKQVCRTCKTEEGIHEDFPNQGIPGFAPRLSLEPRTTAASSRRRCFQEISSRGAPGHPPQHSTIAGNQLITTWHAAMLDHIPLSRVNNPFSRVNNPYYLRVQFIFGVCLTITTREFIINSPRSLVDYELTRPDYQQKGGWSHILIL